MSIAYLPRPHSPPFGRKTIRDSVNSIRFTIMKKSFASKGYLLQSKPQESTIEEASFSRHPQSIFA